MRLTSLLTVAALLAAAPIPAFAQDATQQTAAAAGVNEFAQAAAQNSLTEVLMSTMALQKSKDKRVEEYAWTMLDHHARAMGDLADALSPGAAPLPTVPSPEQTAMLTEMGGLEGAAFDNAYFQHQLESHGRAVGVFEKGGQVADKTVAQYARTTLPVLRAHREIAQIWQAEPPQPVPGQ